LIDVNESLYPVQDGPFTICSAARVFDLTVRVAEQLGEDTNMLPIWRRYRDLSILLVRHRMQQETAKSVFPVWTCYQDLDLDSIPNPKLRVDASVRKWRDSYRETNAGVDQFKTAKQNVSGDYSKPRNWPWGAFQQAFFKASMGSPDDARQALERALKVLLPFGGQCESGEEDFSRIDHPWFTTASGALLRALGRMFVFPQDNLIRLFPGVPTSWRDFSVEMPIFENATIRARVESGLLTQLKVVGPSSRRGQTVRIVVSHGWLPRLNPSLKNVEWDARGSNAKWTSVWVRIEGKATKK
jgi:hypothetical protein